MEIMNVKHYGKNLEDLSKDEKELLLMDTLILLGQQIDRNDKNPMLSLFTDLRGSINSMISQRIELTIKLLNLEINYKTNPYEVLDEIEKSRYGIEKFKRDMKENTERIQQVERMSVLN